MQSTAKKRIGILRGGAGEHYAPSLRKGGEVISYIFENLSDKYKPVDILIDKDYIWHLNGLPVNPADLEQKVDVVWNATHPSYSNILESLSIPSAGVSAFSYTLQNNRDMLREHVKQIGVQMPRHIISPNTAREIFDKFGSPWIVKSFTLGSNTGMVLAKTYPELIDSIEDAARQKKNILVEEFIGGKVASVHSLGGFRGEDVYTFPFGNVFGDFSSEEKEKLTNLAKDIHNHTGAKHYLKSDFVLSPRGKVYLLGIELEPNLKQDSHFSEVCEAAGAKIQQVIEHILEEAL